MDCCSIQEEGSHESLTENTHVLFLNNQSSLQIPNLNGYTF
jgi:hypothetical protein